MTIACVKANGIGDREIRNLKKYAWEDDDNTDNTTDSTDDDFLDRVTPSRVAINEFKVVLSPTPTSFSAVDERDIMKAIQTAINAYGRIGNPFWESAVWRNALLYGVEGSTFENGSSGTRTTQPKTTLVILGGRISINIPQNRETPNATEVFSFVQAAVDEKLVEELANTQYAYITSAVVPGSEEVQGNQEVENVIASGAEVDQESTESLDIEPKQENVAVNESEPSTTSNDDNSSWGMGKKMTVSFLTVAAVVAFLVAGFILRQRRGEQDRKNADNAFVGMKELESGAASTDLTLVEESELGEYRFSGGPTASLSTPSAGDVSLVSDWTMPTATNEFAVLESNSQLSCSRGHPMIETESFEVGRQITLKKDILHTSPGWAGESLVGAKTKNNTVLKPSSFSAIEDKVSIGQQFFDDHNDSDLWDSDDNDMDLVVESPLSFEEANGEKKVILLGTPHAQSATSPSHYFV